MFKITGTVDGVKATCEWKNDKLTGDKIALDKAKIENLKDHGFLGLMPSVVDENYLEFELSAGILLDNFVFDKDSEWIDDWYDEDEQWEKDNPGEIIIY